MSVRRYIFSFIVLVVALLLPYTGNSHDKIIPSKAVMQVAGNMGLFSVGLGWDYGRSNQWETALLYGYIPKEEGVRRYATFTVKQTYTPWSRTICKNATFEPLTCGLYVNTILSRDFWIREPSKYPNGYYGFSTKMRFNVFIGESVTYKNCSLFWELGATDIYVVSKATNRYLKFWDIFGLSFGAKFRFN